MSNMYGRKVIAYKVNKSGGGVIAGDVLVPDTTNDNAFTTTTSAAVTTGAWVADETIASNATGRVVISGHVTLINVSASVTRGHTGTTHTVAKQAVSTGGTTRSAGTFCKFTTGGTTPEADIWPPDLGAGSGLSDPMTTRGDIIVRNSSNTTARLAVGSSGKVLSSDGTDISWQAPAGGLLAVHQHAPGSGGTVYTSADSATLADVDATNMVITFTAPASGNILVRLTAVADASTDDQVWGLRESTTNLIRGRGVPRAGLAGAMQSMAFYLTGVSAGSHTYKWAFSNSSGGHGTQRILVGDGSGALTWPPAIMEVWSAP